VYKLKTISKQLGIYALTIWDARRVRNTYILKPGTMMMLHHPSPKQLNHIHQANLH